MKYKKIEGYEINSCTMFLKPVEYGSRIFTHVFEAEDDFIAPFKPLDIIKTSCNYYGSDYESRKKGTRYLLSYDRKLPIAIEPATNLFFFPTTSPSSPACIWVSYDFIKDFCRVGPQQTKITLLNNQSYIFPVPYSTIESQILRTSLLKAKLMQRIQNNERKFYYFIHKPEEMKASENSDEYGKSMISKGRK